MSAYNLLPLVREVVQGFSLHYQEVTQPLLSQAGFRDGDWFRAFTAYGVDPKAVTPVLAQSIFPYTDPQTIHEAFTASRHRGILRRETADTFRLTAAGRHSMAAFFQTTAQAIANLQLLPAESMTRLAYLLQKLVAATETADISLPKTRLQLSRRTDPGADAATAVRIDQYLTDLTNYADDAYQSAWRAHGVIGYAWEAFDYVTQQDSLTAVSLAEQLARRGYSADDYSAALDSLVDKGWLSRDGEQYSPTDAGRQVRQEVEESSQGSFHAGWQRFTVAEQNELTDLLQQLSAVLRQQGLAHLWPHMNGLMGRAAPLYIDKVAPALAETGLNKPGYFINLWQGLGLAPKPLSAAHLRQRVPFASAESLAERLQQMADDGFLAATAVSGEYVITDKGRKSCRVVDDIFTDELSQLEILPHNQLSGLVETLAGLVERSLHQSDTTDKWSLTMLYNMHRGDEAAPQVKLDEYTDDLNAFRDDAHLTAAAQTAPGLSGPALEALTFLWRDDLNTAAALQQRLAFRGQSEAVYAAALAELAERGWATEHDGRYSLSEAGRTVRQKIETLTNDIFFEPWSQLSSAQLSQLLGQVLRVQGTLSDLIGAKMAEENEGTWPHLLNTAVALSQAVTQRMGDIQEELGLARPFAVFTLVNALTDPKGTVTTTQIGKRFAYFQPQILARRLNELVEEGHLRPGDNGLAGAYYLTEQGREAIQTYLNRYWRETAALQPLDSDKLTRLAELMERIITAIAQIPDVPKVNFVTMQALEKPEEAVALVHIDHALDCLNAFRVDTHDATYKVDSQVWEAFTNVWQQAASSAETIAEKNQERGYTTADYAQALAELVEYDWLTEKEGVYSLTETGQQVRQTAEDKTNSTFYQAWAALNRGERAEVRALVAELEAALSAAVEPVTG